MPITRIADEYGVPVTAVIAACTHLNVPRPRTGHWSAAKFGAAPPRPTLPPSGSGQPQATTLDEWGRRYRKRAIRAETSAEQVAEAAKVVQKPALHPCAAKTLAAYRGGEIDRKYGLLYAKSGKPHLRLAVRPESLERAVGLLSELLTKLEAKGFSVVADPEKPERLTTVFSATKTPVDWLIQEQQERYQRELKPEEKNRSWIWDQWRYRSIGRLRVAITEYHPVDGAAKSWGDGKNLKLDGKLDDIVEGFAVFARERHTANLAREQRQREWEQERRVEEENVAWRAAEEKRRLNFQEGAKRWSAAQELRSFRLACERSLRANLPEGAELSANESKWLVWADRVVDTLDPLRGEFLPRAIQEGRLRELSAAQFASLRISARAMSVSIDDLVSWLSRVEVMDASQALADSVRDLASIADFRSVQTGGSNFYVWLRAPHPALGGRSPLESIAQGRIRDIALIVAKSIPGKSP